MFLSITKKWQSSSWQAVYIKMEQSACTEFSACPAAWLAQTMDEENQKILYKSFTPESVEEANDSECDEENSRIITPSEKKAQAEETEVSNIPWMIDLTELDIGLDENQAVKFKDGIHYNFDDGISLNTTRVHDKSSTSHDNFTSPPKKPRQPISILRNSPDDRTITSEVTTESRINDLEMSVTDLKGMSLQILALIKSQKSTNSNSSDSISETNVASVSPPGGTDE